MNVNELDTIRNSLLLQKSQILNKAAEFRSEQQFTTNIPDESEAASRGVDRNLSIHLHERDRQALSHIERALGKMEAGTYGDCDSCGGPISHRRLLARPFTTLCIECMEEVELQNLNPQ